MKKIVYISGTRADFGLMKKTLQILDKRADLTIIATSMHLNLKYGNTIKEIEDCGFNIKKADTLVDNDDLAAMALTFGNQMRAFAPIIEKISPDAVFVEADRGESLAGAMVGAYLNIPVIHHSGGDLSKSIDNKVRFAITMFSDYHLVTNIRSYGELMGRKIAKEKVFIVGEPGLDEILEKEITPKDELAANYCLNLDKPLVLLVFHPNTEEWESAGKQIWAILNVLSRMKLQTIAVHANADAGGRAINEALESWCGQNKLLVAYPHIGRKDFLGLMNICACMVGNSSSGIIEMPSFKKPFVCVGTRQKNRLKAANAIETSYGEKEITCAIRKALEDKRFLEKLKTAKNPYGDGKSSLRIANTILRILGDKNEDNQ